MTTYEKARTFIHRNARPLDLARWRFHFEGGSADEVLAALSFYQNADGGFGHAIEPDCWLPSSWPIGTWTACCILQEVDAPTEHPIVQGVLRYLDSGADFDPAANQWLNTVPRANDHPHAVWWHYGENGSEFNYNPTAMLAGFALLHATPGTALHTKARRIAKEAIAWFPAHAPAGEQHVLNCFLRLWECLGHLGETIPADFEAALHAAIRQTVCTDANKWHTEYVCHPSSLISGADSPFLKDIGMDAARAECVFLLETQQEDGSWPVVWKWWTPYPEYEVAANWWKSQIIMERMLFLRGFGAI